MGVACFRLRPRGLAASAIESPRPLPDDRKPIPSRPHPRTVLTLNSRACYLFGATYLESLRQGRRNKGKLRVLGYRPFLFGQVWAPLHGPRARHDTRNRVRIGPDFARVSNQVRPAAPPISRSAIGSARATARAREAAHLSSDSQAISFNCDGLVSLRRACSWALAAGGGRRASGLRHASRTGQADAAPVDSRGAGTDRLPGCPRPVQARPERGPLTCASPGVLSCHVDLLKGLPSQTWVHFFQS